jgi:hypothetical protein
MRQPAKSFGLGHRIGHSQIKPGLLNEKPGCEAGLIENIFIRRAMWVLEKELSPASVQ